MSTRQPLLSSSDELMLGCRAATTDESSSLFFLLFYFFHTNCCFYNLKIVAKTPKWLAFPFSLGPIQVCSADGIQFSTRTIGFCILHWPQNQRMQCFTFPRLRFGPFIAIINLIVFFFFVAPQMRSKYSSSHTVYRWS